MTTVTFYSYKGGAGRSSTTLNTLPYLVKTLGADAKHPILLLDMDLDSAGMTYLLNQDKHFQQPEVHDVKSLLTQQVKWSNDWEENLSDSKLYQMFVPVGEILGVENDAIMFLGVDDTSTIDNNEMDGTKEAVFTKLDQFCRNNDISAVVMDSSAGDQFSAQLATQAADDIVCCMRPTMQFRIGTFNYLDRLAALHRTNQRILLLPTVVPNVDREIDGELQKEKAVTNILDRTNFLKKKHTNIMKVDTRFINVDALGINEVERFKWKEGVLYKLSKTSEMKEDELEAMKRYEKLAEALAETGN